MSEPVLTLPQTKSAKQRVAIANPLLSMSKAAKICGLSVDMLKSAIENGDVPGVQILSLGPRKLQFVRSRPFILWLEGGAE